MHSMQIGNWHNLCIFQGLIFLKSLAPGRPKLIPILRENHTNFHQKCMTTKQVLRQVNFVPIFADFWRITGSRNVAGDMRYANSPQIIQRMSKSWVYRCSPTSRCSRFLILYHHPSLRPFLVFFNDVIKPRLTYWNQNSDVKD